MKMIKTTITERLQALRERMRAYGMQAYLVPTEDFHASEYVGDYFKAREYLSGFTGSAGTLVVLEQEAALFTDGRYFIQAKEQLDGTGITLMKSGEAGVPSVAEYLAQKLARNTCIGFDGRTVSRRMADRIREKTDAKGIRFDGTRDLAGEIWTERPPLSAQPVYELPEQLTGSTRAEKLRRLRGALQEKGADHMLVCALDEVAWLLNLRGSDIAYTPVFLSYVLVGPERAELCVQDGVLSAELIGRLAEDHVYPVPYASVCDRIGALEQGTVLLLDQNTVSERLLEAVPEHVTCILQDSPITRMKAVKTAQEMENERIAHVRDGVALTRFIYWLKHTVGTERVTERSAAEKLESLRREQENYLYQSFAPIIAYGAHGAVVHYSATEQTDAVMEPHGFCLADTGGHYMEGTTDVTRTIALGGLTDEEIRAYTTVLRGHLNLAAACFPEGISGQHLDILARMPLWEQGLDYLHGTGHGVGYLLNVHEGPQRIGWRLRAGETPEPFTEGMLVSDEPGLYLEGKFGIRHENLLLCRRGERGMCGQLLYFETLTVVPFDRAAIDVSLLSSHERERLNAYHARVYETLRPYLPTEEAEWLYGQTRPL